MASTTPGATGCFQQDTIGDEFEFFGLTRNFDDAVKFCSDRDSTLARVSSQEEYDLVKDLLVPLSPSIAPSLSRVWLGIHDPDDVTGAGNTGFSFVDGFQNTSFFAKAGEFPWANGEPNDGIQVNENENCVTWRVNEPQRDRWGDDVCSLQRLFLCRKKGSCLLVPPTSAPTESPVLSPTTAPTIDVNSESLSTFQATVLALVAGFILGVLFILGTKKYINKRKREADRGDKRDVLDKNI